MLDSDYRPDEESEELARKLANSTVKDLWRASKSSGDSDGSAVTLDLHARELGIDAPMRDVTFVMEEFAWQLELARQFDGQMPCVRTGDDEQAETVPLSIEFEWPFPRHLRSWRSLRRFFRFPPEFFYEEYRDMLGSRGKSEGISMESSDNVLERLESGLGDFLSYRIAGFRAWMGWVMGKEQRGQGNFDAKGGRKPPGGGGGGKGRSGSGGPPPPPSSWSPGGGLGVEMWCSTPGLTIEFSHAYFIHFMNFGAPSSPVKNTLLAGRYVFQGKGPTYPKGTPRSQVFRVPPDYKAVTTYF
jgi:hypothetical protein